MYRVIAEPMPGNPASKGPGNFGGVWRVAVYEKVMAKGNVFMYYAEENISYEEAQEMATRMQKELNNDS